MTWYAVAALEAKIALYGRHWGRKLVVGPIVVDFGRYRHFLGGDSRENMFIHVIYTLCECLGAYWICWSHLYPSGCKFQRLYFQNTKFFQSQKIPKVKNPFGFDILFSLGILIPTTWIFIYDGCIWQSGHRKARSAQAVRSAQRRARRARFFHHPQGHSAARNV